jgi:hypothetical protein
MSHQYCDDTMVVQTEVVAMAKYVHVATRLHQYHAKLAQQENHCSPMIVE